MAEDMRHHMQSLLMRESLLDRELLASTHDHPVRPMLPDVHAVKIGGRSILDKGSSAVFPLVDELGRLLQTERIIFGVGGGARARHVFAIGLDLGLPTGVLAQLSIADALGNAHILGTLLAPHGVVAIPPEIFGHLLPFFVRAVPGVVFNGDPPFSLWEHPPSVGRIPPHRTDAGSFLVAECFGCKSLTLVKDVDGLYDADPKENQAATRFERISVGELRERNLATLPFDRVLLDLLQNARLIDSFQVVNGLQPEAVASALRGEHVGTLVTRE